ncbi:oligosaccharide repeat unit polymerase [Agarivorans sp. B2Z047]|uniref:O-antigen polymerase n=1 Tax=Agarivorans sp. B2Z047 TaxID=2652721 RepID=UPI00128DBECC|nr:O-antigen polymerase [Agarivorans sp. B2Z047]MPW28715.1 oligosaccharide repeat unit polymerase [Agarivorans sp. B2Z047]UQN41276.1 oligosaccharide repeat unit polymerase [Agarivorans sp. B2Z047]
MFPSLLSVIACVIACSFVVFNSVVFKDFRQPAIIHSVMWASILVLHTFVPHGLFPAGPHVLSVVLFSLVCFTGGAILVAYLFQHRNTEDIVSRYDVPYFRRFYIGYFVMAALVSPLMFNRARSIAAHGTTDSFMMNLRLGLNNEAFGGSFGWMGYLSLVALSALFLVALDIGNKRGKQWFLLILPVALFYVLMSTGRTYFFLLVITLLFIFSFIKPEKFGLKAFASGFFLIFVFFFLIGTIMGKVGEGSGGALSALYVYLLGGVSAIDVVLSSQPDLAYGSNTFRTFYAVLAKLGFEWNPVKLVKDYVYIPHATNVYTVFYPYYLDFGLSYILISQFVFGVFHTVLYKGAIRGGYGYILAYSISVYALFIQWFQDQYLSLLTSWLIVFALLAMPLILTKKSAN